MSLYLFVFFLLLAVLFALCFIISSAAYRRERRAQEEHSSLGLIGKSLYNNSSNLYSILFSIVLSLCFIFGISLIQDLFNVELIHLALLLAGSLLVLILYYSVTPRGQASWRRDKIVRDLLHHRRKEWIAQKHLVRLVRDRDGPDKYQSEIAARTLEILMEQEDMIGDMVRRLMADPDQLIDRYPEKFIPSPLWDYKFSTTLLILALLVIAVSLIGQTLGVTNALFFMYTGFPLFLILSLLGICCHCYERAS